MSEQNNDRIDHGIERARELRRQAEFLERREQVYTSLQRLLEISRDPYYDRYISQMMKDLESGKATPDQVEREARRSYEQYKQRMAMAQNTGRSTSQVQNVKQSPEQKRHASCSVDQVQGGEDFSADRKPEKESRKSAVEYKIGIHVFSIIGAVFVLAAFVIFSFNFLNGLAQGICLYAAALVLVIVSELLLYRKMPAFSHVITGIGVGCLYIANIVNYLVLDTLNGIVAMGITLVIALGTMFYGRKRESTTIRLISLLGYYICLFPIKGFDSEWNFMVFAGMLFIINVVCVLVQNQKNRLAINIVHLAANVIFTAVILGMAWNAGISAVYLVVFLTTSFIAAELMAYMQCREEKEAILFPLICIGNGLYLFMFFLAGNMGEGLTDPALALFTHLIGETLVIVVCILAFLFWDKEDGRRWAQLYFGAGAVLLLSTFADYNLEIIVAILAVLLVVKVLNKHKELTVLECIVVAWTGFMGLWLSDYWYCWVLAAALLAASIRIKRLPVYHEIVTTVSILLIWWSQCNYYFDDFGLEGKWMYPVGAGILLLLLLLYNHIPWYKEYKQNAYNITSVIFMAIYYLMALTQRDMLISAVMMVLGTVTIVLVFSKRYSMHIPKRYFVLTGFLIIYSLLGHFSSPVIVSIILMVVALGCVGIGFKVSDKAARICGLVLAAFVCLKLVLYDFREVETIYRVLVFLVVGILALVISFLYILIEKKIDKRKEIQAEGTEPWTSYNGEIGDEEKNEAEAMMFKMDAAEEKEASCQSEAEHQAVVQEDEREAGQERNSKNEEGID